MYSNIRNGYKNDWLNMLDSVEYNLKCQQPRYPLLPSKYKVYFQQNEWLNYARVLDKILPVLTAREIFWQKHRDNGLPSVYAQRILEFFQTLHQSLLHNGSHPIDRKIYQEYQQQEAHIIPTLARIHRCVKARNEAAGIKIECILTEDEILDIALRAILKRRN